MEINLTSLYKTIFELGNENVINKGLNVGAFPGFCKIQATQISRHTATERPWLALIAGSYVEQQFLFTGINLQPQRLAIEKAYPSYTL
ncbi:Hypothetical predicted protein [Octopus vulgaris]|uniref:Uncharacterized protein n=1 Tax=Octopus vulgaris TaxID=6645 RepID=A0AA36AP77_OCTVU|nr:Hypothetical predicted protein [Octopus vulgaris]